jgi:DNA-binding response OmpR family regulator
MSAVWSTEGTGELSTYLRPSQGSLALGNISLNLDTFQLIVGAEPVDLSPQEFDLLLLLAQHHDRVVPRAVISKLLWRDCGGEYARRLNTAIHRLRGKLEGSLPYQISMVRRRGYGLCRKN